MYIELTVIILAIIIVAALWRNIRVLSDESLTQRDEIVRLTQLVRALDRNMAKMLRHKDVTAINSDNKYMSIIDRRIPLEDDDY